MSRQLIIEGSDLTPAREGLCELLARAAERVRHPESANTQRAYKRAWRAWELHCEKFGLAVLPIEPVQLVTYLELLTAQKLAPNTVRQHLAALASIDRTARVTAADPSPQSLTRSVVVQRWLQSWSRENPRRPRRRAPAATRDQLEHVLTRAQEPAPHSSRVAHVARYARDRCVLLFGVLGAFRGAELAGLDFGDITQTARGLQVLVRSSKTDQHGESLLKGLMPQGTLLKCPVDAWRAWATIRGDWAGPAFVPISRSGEVLRDRLSVDAVRRLVEARAHAAGVKLTSHSLRATFATLAAERKKRVEQIMRQGGWSATKTALEYVRAADLFDDNPSAGLLD